MRLIFIKIFLDCAAMFTVIFTAFYPDIGFVTPFRRGYFETDDSIRYPFIWNPSITQRLLLSVGIPVVVATILLTEIVRHLLGSTANKKSFGGTGHQIQGWVWESYAHIGVYGFGVACTQIIVIIAKYTLGRLRPHFYDACRPSPISDMQNALGYIRRYNCRSGIWDVPDARQSFPSAHASFTMYSAIFLILYIEQKGKWHFAKMLRHLAQFAVILVTCLVGANRISEYYSHWSDVVAGYLIGGSIAAIFFFYILKPKNVQEKSPVPDTQQPAIVFPQHRHDVSTVPYQPYGA